MGVSSFIKNTGRQENDWPTAFKLLGFLVYLSIEGNESLLSGEMISPRTYYRWIEKIDQVGYGEYILDARLQQVLAELVESRFGDFEPSQAREEVLEIVDHSLRRWNS